MYKISEFDWVGLKAVENAVAYLDEDVLPPHWDREILFDMREETR